MQGYDPAFDRFRIPVEIQFGRHCQQGFWLQLQPLSARPRRRHRLQAGILHLERVIQKPVDDTGRVTDRPADRRTQRDIRIEIQYPGTVARSDRPWHRGLRHFRPCAHQARKRRRNRQRSNQRL